MTLYFIFLKLKLSNMDLLKINYVFLNNGIILNKINDLN